MIQTVLYLIQNISHIRKKKIKTERKQPQQYKNAVSTGKGNKKVKLYFHGNIFLLDHTKQQQKKKIIAPVLNRQPCLIS